MSCRDGRTLKSLSADSNKRPVTLSFIRASRATNIVLKKEIFEAGDVQYTEYRLCRCKMFLFFACTASCAMAMQSKVHVHCNSFDVHDDVAEIFPSLDRAWTKGGGGGVRPVA